MDTDRTISNRAYYSFNVSKVRGNSNIENMEDLDNFVRSAKYGRGYNYNMEYNQNYAFISKYLELTDSQRRLLDKSLEVHFLKNQIKNLKRTIVYNIITILFLVLTILRYHHYV